MRIGFNFRTVFNYFYLHTNFEDAIYMKWDFKMQYDDAQEECRVWFEKKSGLNLPLVIAKIFKGCFVLW